MADTSTYVPERSRGSFRAKADMAFQTLNDIHRKLEDLKDLVKNKKTRVDVLNQYEAEQGASQDQSRTESIEALQAEILSLDSDIIYLEDEVNYYISTFDCQKQSFCSELISFKNFVVSEVKNFAANKLSTPSPTLRGILSGRRLNVPVTQPLEELNPVSEVASSQGNVASTTRCPLSPFIEEEFQKFREQEDILFEKLDNLSNNLSQLKICTDKKGAQTKKVSELEYSTDDADDVEEEDHIDNVRKLSMLGLQVRLDENEVNHDIAAFDIQKWALSQQLLSLSEGLNERLDLLSLDRLRKSSLELTKGPQSARPLDESLSTDRSRGRSRSRASADLSLSPSRGGRRSRSRSSPRATTEQNMEFQKDEQHPELQMEEPPREEQHLEPPREQHPEQPGGGNGEQHVEQVGGGISAANVVGVPVVNAEEDPFEGLDEGALLGERFLIDVDELLNDPGN